MNKKLVIVYIACVAVLATAFVSYKKQVTGIEVGEKATEVVLKDPAGKEIKLSSLKGKVVLLDFWASWCGPCRKENPNVVQAYTKYKDAKFKNGKGFTVYSVSLDRNEAKWKEAIAKDGLVWKYHGWDQQKTAESPAQVYHVEYIPTNFLIDGDGKIVAKNLRGADLDAAIGNLLKTK